MTRTTHQKKADYQEHMSVQYIPPYTPLFYGKTWVNRVYLFFLFLIQNLDYGQVFVMLSSFFELGCKKMRPLTKSNTATEKKAISLKLKI